MKKGQIFELFQDGKSTKIVMFINESDVLILDGGTLGAVIKGHEIDCDNELGSELADISICM